MLNDKNELHCCSLTFERLVIATMFKRHVMSFENLLTLMGLNSGLKPISGLIEKTYLLMKTIFGSESSMVA